MLTLPQARKLIAATFQLSSLNPLEALKIVQYHMRRNHIAYWSHRKKKLAQLKFIKLDLSL